LMKDDPHRNSPKRLSQLSCLGVCSSSVSPIVGRLQPWGQSKELRLEPKEVFEDVLLTWMSKATIGQDLLLLGDQRWSICRHEFVIRTSQDWYLFLFICHFSMSLSQFVRKALQSTCIWYWNVRGAQTYPKYSIFELEEWAYISVSCWEPRNFTPSYFLWIFL
jgi:hypothetical protein